MNLGTNPAFILEPRKIAKKNLDNVGRSQDVPAAGM
jgi:hypothetical protein